MEYTNLGRTGLQVSRFCMVVITPLLARLVRR